MQLFAILADGLIYASWLFIVAAGLTLVYGVMKILNLAHGSLYAIGAYSAASLIGWYFSQGMRPGRATCCWSPPRWCRARRSAS